MAVPNTTTFSLQDVVNEVGPSSNDLVQCFADANAGGFDPAYEGSKNQLLNFRNYNQSLLADFVTNNLGQDPSIYACIAILDTTRYHNGAGVDPVNGDIIYTDSGGTTLFNGGGLYYANTQSYSFVVSTIGVVSEYTVCP